MGGVTDHNRSYTVEVMSYDIRSKLICTQNLLVQATITGFNYLNPVALENITWKYGSDSTYSSRSATHVDLNQILHYHLCHRGSRDHHGLLHLPRN